MNILSRLKISTKILLLLLMLGAVTVTIAFAGKHAIMTADDANTQLVAEAKAPIYLARANRRANQMVYASLNTVAYDCASQQARTAAAAEQEMYETAKSYFGQAIAAKPSLKDIFAVSVQDYCFDRTDVFKDRGTYQRLDHAAQFRPTAASRQTLDTRHLPGRSHRCSGRNLNMHFCEGVG